MSFCFLYNVVSENYSVQNSPWGGGGSIASSRSIWDGNISVVKTSSTTVSYGLFFGPAKDQIIWLHFPLLD